MPALVELRPPNPDFDDVADRVLALAREGAVKKAVALFSSVKSGPATPEEAVDLTRRLVLPIFSACERFGNVEAACTFEELVYLRLIRAFELPSHYEACFALFEDVLHRLGRNDRSAAGVAGETSSASEGRLLFFFHNASSTGAHVPLFCDIVNGYLESNPHLGPTLAITGSVVGEYAPRIKALQEQWGVSLRALGDNACRCDTYAHAVQLVESEQYDRLIIVAPPIGLAYLSGRLHPKQLGWFTMKFELNCFQQLENRASVISSLDALNAALPRRQWHQAPPFLTEPVSLTPSGKRPAVLNAAREHPIVLYTINREQKIRNPDFLRAVSDVLDRLPGAGFVWTGSERLCEIDDYFADRGLLTRTYFAGWIHPDDLILMGDVFLDTPMLSGTVAARAAVAGKPVVTFARSQSWINVFAQIHGEDAGSGSVPPSVAEALLPLGDLPSPFEFDGHEAYVYAAVRLATDEAFRNAYGAALGAFTTHYYYDRRRWAARHFANLRHGL